MQRCAEQLECPTREVERKEERDKKGEREMEEGRERDGGRERERWRKGEREDISHSNVKLNQIKRTITHIRSSKAICKSYSPSMK